MAGTVTTSEKTHTSVKRVKFEWTSGTGADDGKADATTVAPFDGVVTRAVFIPGTGGDLPSDLYDVRVLDDDGLDVVQGNGADLSHDAAREAYWHHATYPLYAMVAGSKLTLEVRNAGDTKKGTVILYVR